MNDFSLISLGSRAAENADPELKPWRLPEPVRDGFRSLHATLRMSQQSSVIGITSLLPTEGVSWVATNLARAFGEASDPVALVDVSAGRFTLAETYGLNKDPAVTADLDRRDPSFTIGKDLIREGLPKPAEETQALAPRALVTADGVRDARREIPQLLRFCPTVLIDCQPLGTSSQVLQLGHALTGVLIVVQAERARREPIAAAIAKLERAGLLVLGTVLNKRRRYIPTFLYR